MNTKRNLIVIMPALNPGPQIMSVAEGVLQEGFGHLIVVNDGSTEEYDHIFAQLANRQGITVLEHCVNLGKGRALKTAVNYAVTHFPECAGVVTADADGQHEIPDIVKCGEALAASGGENTIILGCRSFSDAENRKVPFRSKFGNVCTRTVMRYLCNIKISDTQTGLRAIPRHLLPQTVKIAGEGYEYETNVLLELTEGGVLLDEIPITTVYEERNCSSHFNPLTDSFRIYRTIFSYSFSSLLGALADYAAFALLLPHIGNLWLLTYMGRLISVLVNFTLNKKFVFKCKGRTWPFFLKYILLTAVSGTVSAFALIHVGAFLGGASLTVKIGIESVLFFFNYYVQKRHIFVKPSPK